VIQLGLAESYRRGQEEQAKRLQSEYWRYVQKRRLKNKSILTYEEWEELQMEYDDVDTLDEDDALELGGQFFDSTERSNIWPH
jgi:hypothetical protein